METGTIQTIIVTLIVQFVYCDIQLTKMSKLVNKEKIYAPTGSL